MRTSVKMKLDVSQIFQDQLEDTWNVDKCRNLGGQQFMEDCMH